MPAFLVLGVAVAMLATFAARSHKKDAARPAVQHFELDRDMPPAVVDRVLGALTREDDSATLDALAHELEPKYPLSASELHAKATALRGGGAPAPHEPPHEHGPPPPPAIAAGPASSPPAAPPPALAPSPAAAPSAAGTDAASVLQAAMRALVQERDPVMLDGFAASIAQAYPMAASLLAARARELRAAAPSPPAPPPTASFPVHAPPTTPAITAASYIVKPGDSASTIALKLVHDSHRWPELVAANPTKPKASDGNFATLRPGEALQLPAAWLTPHTSSPAAQPAHEVHG